MGSEISEVDSHRPHSKLGDLAAQVKGQLSTGPPRGGRTPLCTGDREAGYRCLGGEEMEVVEYQLEDVEST